MQMTVEKMELNPKLYKSELILSGSELFKYRKPADKSLPNVGGSKDFAPDGSWLQSKKLEKYYEERLKLLGEQRVERIGNIVTGDWNSEKQLVELHKELGKFWVYMGFVDSSRKWLYPEEALYLMETNAMEVSYKGLPLSIQQAYRYFFNSTITLDQYQVYTHLRRLGYVIIRHQGRFSITEYERKLKLDQHMNTKKSKSKKRKAGSDKNSTTYKVKKVEDTAIEDMETSDSVNKSDIASESNIGPKGDNNEETVPEGRCVDVKIGPDQVCDMDLEVSKDVDRQDKDLSLVLKSGHGTDDKKLHSDDKKNVCVNCDNNKRTICDKCDSAGKVTCDKCNSSRRTISDKIGIFDRTTCDQCEMIGRNTCDKCDSTGRTTCNKHDNTGRTTCDKYVTYKMKLRKRTLDPDEVVNFSHPFVKEHDYVQNTQVSTWNFSEIIFPDIWKQKVLHFSNSDKNKALFPAGISLPGTFTFDVDKYLQKFPEGNTNKMQDDKASLELEYSFPSCNSKPISAQNWREYKAKLKTLVDEDFVLSSPVSHLWNGEVKPLVKPSDGFNTGTILDKLQVIKSEDVQKTQSAVLPNIQKKVIFDVYLPDSKFKKSSPGLPHHRLCVVRHSEPLPDLETLSSLHRYYTDGIPIHWAVVDCGDIAFYDFTHVNMPVIL